MYLICGRTNWRTKRSKWYIIDL